MKKRKEKPTALRALPLAILYTLAVLAVPAITLGGGYYLCYGFNLNPIPLVFFIGMYLLLEVVLWIQPTPFEWKVEEEEATK